MHGVPFHIQKYFPATFFSTTIYCTNTINIIESYVKNKDRVFLWDVEELMFLINIAESYIDP